MAHRQLAAASGQAGFSLVELVVVLVVMGLLLGSLTMPLAAQGEMRARRETDKALEDIRDALIGYAIVHGRLPCPAVAAMSNDAAGAGMEARRDGNCACSGSGKSVAALDGSVCDTPTVTGVLPWRNLNLPETDGWGRRYTYSVDAKFGRDSGQGITGCTPSVEPLRAGFALCSLADIYLKSAAGGPNVSSNGVPAVVVSHGPNGYGAYTPQGAVIAPDPGSADERENADGDRDFVSNTNIDDRMTWVPLHLLMHRMLSAGMLP